ncbi:DNA protecting protein DprA [Candidatus Nomurabacteria bacterium RIFCSPLOWO2_02_FULL_42_17]|uniref:DNA protecting protein DprA n=1 Tax=Candidatus Nomurabacteria bacterium RIFCSPLOWO2_02_FULL_42_17 TaxID=1801789 RepID=A0A1F6XQN8_9BACT|nr:MAG: DNA protecting protein DprA [Candidatus Nomurabacteria bacterium RIFCSPLOWO2_02_FULL_42_17]
MANIRKLKKEEFPKTLLEIPQPPKELWLEGVLPSDEKILLCVVGSRRLTSYGKEVCRKLISGLKGYPVVIVSGLAVGIDTIAHQTALEAGLPAMALPGSGLSREVIYPSSNISLADRIVENGGCLLSEFPPETKATQWGFPQRNRLMAGLARAVLIVEAGQKSGTLITARLALDYNRDVLAVPGPIFAPNSQGTNWLIRQGATPITSPEDLLEALGFSVERPDQKMLFEDCSPEERAVLDLLIETLPRDEIIRQLDWSASKASAVLATLELKGLIKESLGELHRI